MIKEQFDELLTLVRMTHHGLTSVDDPTFVKDEIAYKRKAAEKAAELLSSAELQSLIDSEDLAELKSRVLKVGATNLLWNSVPMQGDLALFHSELLDLDVFRKFRELLYGEEASEERLQSWSDYLDSRGLNNKWTTPTYFLFLLFPQAEYFVKPSAASWLLKQAGLPTPLEAKPSGDVYGAIRQVASEALMRFQGLGAKDMIDVQSLLWVAHWSSQKLQKQFADAKGTGAIHFSERARKSGFPEVAGRVIHHVIDQGPLSNEKLTAFIQLFRHGTRKEETVRKNLAVCGAEGFADEFLAVSAEGGYTAAGRLAIEGLDVSQLETVRMLLLNVAAAGNFDEVAAAVEVFESADVPFVKHGIYSPWLHYLQPTICPLLNNAVIDSFRSIGFPRTGSYVEAMRIARAASRQIGVADLGDLDTMFYAEREKPAEVDSAISYWKIAPGENAWEWDECRDKGFIAIGWDDMGNVIGLDEAQFWARREELLKKTPGLESMKGWSKAAVRQLWEFVHLKPGDRVVANRGKSLVLGIGTVAGEPFYIDGERHGHRLPVKWGDLTQRLVNKPRWFRTMLSLGKEEFDEIRAEGGQGAAEGAIPGYSDEMLNLLHHGLMALGVSSPDDLRVALNLTRKGKTLSLSYGDWLLLSIPALGYPEIPLTVNLDTKLYAPEEYRETIRKSFSFAKEGASFGLFRIPVDLFRSERDRIVPAFDSALERAKEMFAGWTKTPHRKPESMPMLARLLGAEYVEPKQEQASEPEELHQTPFYLNPVYSVAEMEEETGQSEEVLRQWLRAIERKKQAIIYGPPGTGKTYVAQHLARHLASGGVGMVKLVQFHPSYTYEDFIQGIRPEPAEGGGLKFPVKPGRFLQFCAEADSRRPDICVLIIDEINRANLSKVFGELMYLLEYRDRQIPLTTGEMFGIPPNVRIVGTMNTADRSIALVDFALRRRFAFIRMQPQLELLRKKLPQMSPDFPVDRLIDLLTELNRAIGEDGFKIGITYFLDHNLENNIESIWLNEIEPYLEEFFFERPEMTDQYRWTSVAGRLKG